MTINKNLIPYLLTLAVCTPVAVAQQTATTAAVNATHAMQANASLEEQVASLQTAWAQINYQTPDNGSRIEAFEALEGRAEKTISSFPGEPGPKIWQGIILSTHAGVVNGLSALSKVKKAKALFEEALKIDEAALDGSAHTSLGSLYYKVPGWPLGFGSDKKAEEHLKKALAMNPNGIDPNYFYGEFLYEEGRYDEAVAALNLALQAPDRPHRPLADAGRRQEIQVTLVKVQKKLAN